MSFRVPAEAYDLFMGRYSVPLAPQLASFAEVTVNQRILDVGCRPGALTTELVRRLGPAAVTAIDPSEQFVRAVGGLVTIEFDAACVNGYGPGNVKAGSTAMADPADR